LKINKIIQTIKTTHDFNRGIKIDEEEKIILKTAFPSRKFHKKYGEKDEKD
jgi:hypothetical protein